MGVLGLGLELGERLPLGLGTFPLWALGPDPLLGLGLVSGHRLGSGMGRLALRGWLHRLGSAAPGGVCGRRPALAALLVLRPEQRLHLPRRVGVPAPGGP